MKTWTGYAGNRNIPVEKVKLEQVPFCIKNNITCNTGKVAYIANEDGTQGLMSKVEGGRVYFFVNGRWQE